MERKTMNYKKCPKCELNYIRDDEELCSECKCSNANTTRFGTQNHRPRTPAYFNEDFTFRNETVCCDGTYGFKAYNSQNINVGIVYMTYDKRSPSYGSCELLIFERYRNIYGKYHRFTSYWNKLNWNTLCAHLSTDSQYTCHID